MKKNLLMIVAAAGLMAFAACGNKSEAPAANDEQAATEQAAAEDVPSLADLVAKAKAEGANWSVDEWKEQFKLSMLAIKPMTLEISEVMKKMEAATPEEAAKLAEEIEALQKKYPDIDKLLEEFVAAAQATENGKVVVDDEEWGKKTREELGIPEL